MIGQTISHYQIIEKIGEGGMGVVYRAHDTKLDRTVALKFLPSHLTVTDEDKERFIREAKAAAALNHPNICTIHNVDEHDANQFIVMEYVEGMTLRQRSEVGGRKSGVRDGKSGSQDPETALNYAIQIAEALQQAHLKDIVHRDIKPENIMVTEDNRIKVMDFGLAKLKGTENLTKTRSTVGTLGYMSPEQIQGNSSDHRSDIFSFGVVLYEMLTGQKPFRGEHEAAMVYSIVNEAPQPVQTYLPDAPSELDHIINRVLEKDPGDRYQSINDLLIDLRRLKKGSGQRPVSGVREFRGKSNNQKSNPGSFSVQKAAVGMAALSVVAIVIWFAIFSSFKDTASTTHERKMLVVLPFQNLGDSEMDYLVDGITDEITSSLTTLSGLGVIGRASAVRYKNTTKLVSEIGDELGVSYIMDGTVRWERRPDGEILIRVNPQLIRVSDATQVWAQSFDAVLSGVLALQSDIATQVAGALDVTLRANEIRVLTTERSVDPDAYELYLRGVQYFSRGYTESDFRIAINLYTTALERDPLFSSAHAKLSRAYSSLYWFHYDRSDEVLRQSESSARRAIELAPDYAEGYEALGWYYYHGLLDYGRAISEFTKALDIQPQNASVNYGIAAVNRRQGNFEESRKHFTTAANLNPTDPIVLFNTGETHWLMREYDTSLKYFDRVINLAPDWADVYYFKALALIQRDDDISRAISVLITMREKGLYSLRGTADRSAHLYIPLLQRNYEEVLEELDQNPGFTLTTQFEYITGDLFRAILYHYSGDHNRARTFFQSVQNHLSAEIDQNPSDPRLYISMGITLAGLGRRDEAIRHGERAVEILPLSREAYRGAYLLEGLARIYTMTGEFQKAIDALETLLSRPSHLNYVLIRLDPVWDPLRGEARFQKLITEYR
jgi:eukaryotic-like serine/threonine-protein kinase